MNSPLDGASARSLLLERHLSPARLSTYVQHCAGDLDAAVVLYEWNTAATSAFWAQLGHVEVVLRNALDRRLRLRHTRLGRSGAWTDDPARELRPRARDDIAVARDRAHRKGKTATHDQVMSELTFGFWRFLLSNAYSGSLWPDLAGAFPHAPSRNRALIETPVVALNDFRNRLGHHERIWSEPLADRARDLDDLARFVDPDVADWIRQSSDVPMQMRRRPYARRQPMPASCRCLAGLRGRRVECRRAPKSFPCDPWRSAGDGGWLAPFQLRGPVGRWAGGPVGVGGLVAADG